jgi:hypothetical protein
MNASSVVAIDAYSIPCENKASAVILEGNKVGVGAPIGEIVTELV